MRDQVHNKKTSMSDHVQILETLREEITIMTERKMDLERRIVVLCLDYRQLGLTGVLAGSVHGEGGSELHLGRERGQDRDAGEGGEGARLSGERTSQSDRIITVQYSTVQYSTEQCSTVQYNQTRSQALISDQMKVTDGAGQEAGETSQ